jgi:hypothetical protein
MHAIAALNVNLRAADSTTFAYSKVHGLPATLRRSGANIQIFLPLTRLNSFGDTAGNVHYRIASGYHLSGNLPDGKGQWLLYCQDRPHAAPRSALFAKKFSAEKFARTKRCQAIGWGPIVNAGRGGQWVVAEHEA